MTMGIVSGLRKLLGQNVYVYGNDYIPVSVAGMSARDLYESQANLHAVVSFLSASIAQLPIKVYTRKGETDRQRDRNSTAALLLYKPNSDQTAYEFIESLALEFFLYGEAIVWVLPDSDSESGYQLRIIPSEWIEKIEHETNYGYKSITIRTSYGQPVVIPRDQFVIFKMYRPGVPSSALSPIDSLKQALIEQIEADKFRTSIWKSSGRFNSYITRPANVQRWEKPQRDAWVDSFRKGWSEGGQKQGSMPILEDGMEIKTYQLNSKEAQYIESKQLTREDVAAAYHINPSLIWHTDTQTYASAKDNARALYADCLGPTLQMLQQRINSFLLPMIGANPATYVEFDLEEKLKGSFEERAQIYQSACGVPYLTVNEVRADLNRAPIEGGDERVIPLNVLVGGQMSEQDSVASAYDYDGVDNRAKTEPEKSQLFSEKKDNLFIIENNELEDEDKKAFEDLLKRFFERQKKSVIPKIGAKAQTPDWWDTERWNTELAKDLYDLCIKIVGKRGEAIARQLGSDFYSKNTVEYLKKVAKAKAILINTDTLEKLEAIENIPEDADTEAPTTPDEVFGKRKDFDAALLGISLAMVANAFATREAINQAAYQGKVEKSKVYKVWVTGANPRPEHAAMNGEKVGIDDKFSNGADWVGDSFLGPEQTCGCNCSIRVEIER